MTAPTSVNDLTAGWRSEDKAALATLKARLEARHGRSFTDGEVIEMCRPFGELHAEMSKSLAEVGK